MFVDASAIIGILTGEPEADAMAKALNGASQPITSALAVFEAAMGISRKRNRGLDDARQAVDDFITASAIDTVPITAADARTALAAASRYGKGRGHPAQLNLGDCFAYAVAKNRQASLLFKGDDFGKTDITPAC